jgi:hypothetical protein
MKIIFLSILYLFVLDSFSLEWLDRSEFTDKTEGYIVEKNGDTTYGLVKIKCNGFSEDIVVETKTDIIKIDPILVKSINKINQTIIPVFLFDSTQLIYGVVIDTTQQFKVYQGYAVILNGVGGFGGMNTSGINVQFKTCFVVLEADSYDAVFYSGKMSKGGQKRALKKNFSDDSEVLKFLDTIDEIGFEDIPKVMEQVNIIHKR